MILNAFQDLGGGNALNITEGRVYISPLIIKFTCTISHVGWVNRVVSGNVIVGLYADNGDTPVGGAVIDESVSGAIVAGVNEKKEVALPNTPQLTPGLYWIASEFDDALDEIARHNLHQSLGGTLNLHRYNRGGGYGALTDPCPATTIESEQLPTMYVVVSSVP